MCHFNLIFTAIFLRRGRQLEYFSDGLFIVACLALAFSGNCNRWLLIGAVLLGALSKYFALRVALDAELFEFMANSNDQLEQRTRQLDAWLKGAQGDEDHRCWNQRIKGARQLLFKQCVLCLLEVLMFIAAILM